MSLVERGRLGFGEYVPYEGVKISLAREWFLEAVRLFAKWALEELSGKPYQLYLNSGIAELSLTRERREVRLDRGEEQPAVRSGRDIWDVWEHCNRGDDYEGVHLQPLRLSLLEWAKNAHLEAEWCVRHAFYTLDYWNRNPSGLSQLTWGPFADIIIYGRYQEDVQSSSLWAEPPAGFRRWLPGSERRDEYLRTARELIANSINNDPYLSHGGVAHRRRFVNSIIDRVMKPYCLEVEKTCKSLGWVKITEWPELKRYLRWAARIQVRGISPYMIARAAKGDEVRVRREVNKTLLLIGLIPRSNPTGRRQGRKDSKKTRRQKEKKKVKRSSE